MAAVLQPPKLSQATIVVGTIAAAWVLYLAAQNKLIVYWQLLLGQGSGTAGGGGSSSPSPNPSPTPSAPAPAPAGPQTGTTSPGGQAPFTGGLN